MSLTKERSFYLDNVKSVLIFFVVIGHFAEVAVSHSDIFKSLFLWLYTFHMPLFIFITGYLSKNLINNKERVLKKSFEYFTLYFFLNIFIFFTRYFAEGHKTFYILKESSVPWYLLAISIMILASYFLRNINPKVIVDILADKTHKLMFSSGEKSYLGYKANDNMLSNIKIILQKMLKLTLEANDEL